jgi:uncharacterized membrane protein
MHSNTLSHIKFVNQLFISDLNVILLTNHVLKKTSKSLNFYEHLVIIDKHYSFYS